MVVLFQSLRAGDNINEEENGLLEEQKLRQEGRKKEPISLPITLPYLLISGWVEVK
jgi:hypothetical protein